MYILSPVELETWKTYIETNWKTRFIWLSKSPACSPILFNKKSDDSFCLCVNYLYLNNLIMKNQYLLPLIGEALDCPRWAKQFTQLDLIHANHPMRISEDDKWKTAFHIQYGHLKYQVMLFGLSYALTSFESNIYKIPHKKLDIFLIVYWNNFLIYTEKISQLHMEEVCWVFNQLQWHALFDNLKTCWFYQDKVQFRG